jgi:Trehalose utilisation.
MKLMKRIIWGVTILAFAGLAGFLTLAAQAPAPAAPDALKEIVFLSGPVDHGRPGSGSHDYVRDLKLLQNCLENSPNVKIKTKFFEGKAPAVSEFQDAAAIVVLSSSDRDAKETHPLFPPDPTTDHQRYNAETTAYLKSVDALTRKGMGVVVLHYAVWAENWAARSFYMQWLGGLWVQIPSKNPMDEWSMTLMNESHPILRGVKPWKFSEEIFCNFFLPRDPRRTDLLLATPAKSPVGPQVAAFAFQREDGHRGLTFGGVHFHKNLGMDDHRRFLLNGIVWAAGMEVPAGGVQSTVSEELLKQ